MRGKKGIDVRHGGTLACDTGCYFDTSDCYSLPTCGNGDIDAPEVCDGTALGGETCVTQGFGQGTLACATDCMSYDTSGCPIFSCGNGQQEAGEACDDGNTTDCDGCRGDCSAVETGCGDGFVCGVEVCDDGNTTTGDGCAADCSSDETCGNAIIDTGEDCESGNLSGQSCEILGFIGGALACDSSCEFDTSGCYTLDEDPALVAHWRFDDGGGTTAVDSSPNLHHGTLHGGPSFVSGVDVGALQLDDIDDNVEVPDAVDLRAQRPLTVSSWILRDALGDDDIILRKRGGNNRGWQLSVSYASDRIFFSFFGASGADVESTGTVSASNWHHVAVTVSAAGTVAFYIDGLPSGTTTIGAPLTTTEPLRMGAWVNSMGTVFGYSDMLIDDVRIYSRVLTGPEVGILATP